MLVLNLPLVLTLPLVLKLLLILTFPCVAAVCAVQKMEKEGPLSERSEFRAFPFFVLHKREPRRGGYAWVAFL
ncbi:hypothetical protein [Undibacterium sp. Tian12W]|uniref:hypothetical protein n=1 Tax=Undibacterium sp. Tian12W TaxID=3413054 RepID=UPI003BF229DC